MNIFNTYNILNCILYTTPYMLTALAFTITYRGNVFNIGVEGGFIISSVTACAIGIIYGSLPPFLLAPLAIISGIASAILFYAIIFYLKTKHNINYIFTMIIFNYIALHLSNYLINLPILKSTGGAETSKKISSNAFLSLSNDIISKYNLPQNTNLTIIIAITLCILVALMFKYMVFGKNIDAINYNKKTSIISGIDVDKTLFKTYMLSAIIVGLAGSLYVLSTSKRISVLPMFESYGYTGILIALFSRSNPIIIIFSSLFIGALKYSGRYFNIINMPSQISDLIISLIILISATYFSLKQTKGEK